jgi:hypothetical protein
VWQIDNEDLSVLVPSRAPGGGGIKLAGPGASTSRGRSAKSLPGNATEKEGFNWVPQIAQVVPEAGDVDPNCLAPHPRKGLIAGRLQLDQGTLKTYRLAEFYADRTGGVPTFLFKPLAPSRSRSVPASRVPARGIADWTVVDIPVQGCEVKLSAHPFGNAGKARTITLAPEACKPGAVVEVALINLPDRSLLDTAEAGGHAHGPEGIASHFEIYYGLAGHRPPPQQRLVPVVTGSYLDPDQLHQGEEASPLLRGLGMGEKDHGGTFSRPICTQAVFKPSSLVKP